MITYQFEPSNPPKGWLPRYGVFGLEGDRLFVPVEFSGLNPLGAILCASHDGETLYESNGVQLVSADWILREFPKSKDLIQKIAEKAELVKADSLIAELNRKEGQT